MNSARQVGAAGPGFSVERWSCVSAPRFSPSLPTSQIFLCALAERNLGCLGAGVLWGTMYIPYRKAYLTGMNPLSFVTFFTFGELGMMAALAVTL